NEPNFPNAPASYSRAGLSQRTGNDGASIQRFTGLADAHGDSGRGKKRRSKIHTSTNCKHRAGGITMNIALPPGWEAKPGPDGRTVYINHHAKTTQYERPVAVAPSPPQTISQLPAGWEAKPGPAGGTVYINHITKVR
ncbi:unnamed protein product, partial [Ascophyllum nodosum]